MKLNNFLYSGFEFNEDEDLLKFKFKMINIVLVIVMVFSASFGLMYDFGANDIGPIHSKIDYAYSFCAILIILFLRKSKNNYNKSAHLLFILSIITFTSALINVPQDEFRIIWFYLLIYLVFMISSNFYGIAYTVISILIILVSNYYIDLELSQIAIKSAVLGLIIGSLLSRTYTNKISDYENALEEKNKRLQHLATTDGLTGIINRRYFDEVSNNYFETAQRYGNHISLLIMDLDYFKTVNDTYGHGVGDEVLISVVEKIKPFLRKSDIFARVGGEEFAILLFNTDSENAYNLAEKICEQIRDISIECGDKTVTITTSIGISENKKSDMSFKDIYVRSDKALYHAKEEGRDRVCTLR